MCTGRRRDSNVGEACNLMARLLLQVVLTDIEECMEDLEDNVTSNAALHHSTDAAQSQPNGVEPTQPWSLSLSLRAKADLGNDAEEGSPPKSLVEAPSNNPLAAGPCCAEVKGPQQTLAGVPQQGATAVISSAAEDAEANAEQAQSSRYQPDTVSNNSPSASLQQEPRLGDHQQARNATRLTCRELDWEKPDQIAALGTFDVVLVADVVSPVAHACTRGLPHISSAACLALFHPLHNSGPHIFLAAGWQTQGAHPRAASHWVRWQASGASQLPSVPGVTRSIGCFLLSIFCTTTDLHQEHQT